MGSPLRTDERGGFGIGKKIPAAAGSPRELSHISSSRRTQKLIHLLYAIR